MVFLLSALYDELLKPFNFSMVYRISHISIVYDNSFLLFYRRSELLDFC